MNEDMQIVQTEFDLVKPENEGGFSPHNQLGSTHGCAAAALSLSPRKWGCRLVSGRELKRTHELNLCLRAIPSSAALGEKSGPLTWLARIASARARVACACASLANQVNLLLTTLKENEDDSRFA